MTKHIDEQTKDAAGLSRRQKYVSRIVVAVHYKGNADHEDVHSILQEYEQENLDLINLQKAEIARLEDIIRCQEDGIIDLNCSIAEAKSGAIKGFAEKLKTEINELEAKSPNKTYQKAMEDMLTYYFPQIIDECLKEAVGDTK